MHPLRKMFIKHKYGNRAIILKTSGTDAVCAKKTIPQMRFHQVLTLWTCFPCMFDMSTMLKLCWNWFWAFWAVSSGHFLKLLPFYKFEIDFVVFDVLDWHLWRHHPCWEQCLGWHSSTPQSSSAAAPPPVLAMQKITATQRCIIDFMFPITQF